MSLSPAFLDEVRARTVLSALVGRTVKLTRAGREFKGCCPVHAEKTPSFTVNDDKGFTHCFGCGYHADAIRWVQDSAGLGFVDAVRELAAAAGLAMPERSPEAAEREQKVETVRGALETAQAAFAAQLEAAGAVMEYLAGRGVGPAEIAAFGIGYARAGDGSLKGRGIGEALGIEAGLLRRWDDPGSPASARAGGSGAGGLREVFHDRITIPIHDHRGRLIGFGGRVWPGPSTGSGFHGMKRPKFLNSPDGPLFDKGATLFNLHRAAPALRQAQRERELKPLLIVEGYFDVIAMTRAGFAETVAPMGTALTERQLVRAWRVHHRPVLLFDGDAAGRRAAVRAGKVALPHVGPGRELAVALLPEGCDPDDLVRLGPEGMGQIDAALGTAQPLHDFLFDAALRGEL